MLLLEFVSNAFGLFGGIIALSALLPPLAVHLAHKLHLVEYQKLILRSAIYKIIAFYVAGAVVCVPAGIFRLVASQGDIVILLLLSWSVYCVICPSVWGDTAQNGNAVNQESILKYFVSVKWLVLIYVVLELIFLVEAHRVHNWFVLCLLAALALLTPVVKTTWFLETNESAVRILRA